MASCLPAGAVKRESQAPIKDGLGPFRDGVTQIQGLQIKVNDRRVCQRRARLRTVILGIERSLSVIDERALSAGREIYRET
jgi:hypothetical protein